jgi:hypothetical protein
LHGNPGADLLGECGALSAFAAGELPYAMGNRLACASRIDRHGTAANEINTNR